MELALGIIGGVLVTAALAAGFWRYSRTGASQVADDLASARLSLTEAETRLRSETERADTLAHERDDAREQARLHAEALAQTRLAHTEAETRLKSETERADTLTRERDDARKQVSLREGELAQAQAEVARLTADRQARMEEINKARAELDLKFKGIADEVMRTSNENFLKQANAQFDVREQAVRHLVEPVGKEMEKIRKFIGEAEEKRSGDHAGLTTLIGATQEQMNALRTETGRLNSALRSPRIRGRWGEQLLENLFEMSHLRENVDYRKQVTATTEDGQQRPDFIVNIPGGMQVVIDAKVPLESYLDALATKDEQEQTKLLDRHAASLGGHARDLGRKDYAGAINGALDLTVLFVPADAILDAAMRANDSVWEDAWRQHKVLIATPSVIIALLSTIAAAWQREQIQHNAEEIVEAAQALCRRLGIYTGHINRVGAGLRQAVTAYNDSIASFESRLLVQARRVEDLRHVPDADRIDAPQPVTHDIRPLIAPEATEEAEAEAPELL